MTSGIERRFSTSPISIGGNPRQAVGTKSSGRTISGYAAVYNSRSANLGTADKPWFEVLAPGCFAGVLNQDVRCLLDHDSALVLARSRAGQGTLRIGSDSVGLSFNFEAPETTLGNDLIVSLRRGDIDGCSFGFRIAPGGDSFTKLPDGAPLRTITKIDLLAEITICAFPAYPASNVGVRQDALPVSECPTQLDKSAVFFGRMLPVTAPQAAPAARKSFIHSTPRR